jgi:hypothetical protein
MDTGVPLVYLSNCHLSTGNLETNVILYYTSFTDLRTKNFPSDKNFFFRLQKTILLLE